MTLLRIFINNASKIPFKYIQHLQLGNVYAITNINFRRSPSCYLYKTISLFKIFTLPGGGYSFTD